MKTKEEKLLMELSSLREELQNLMLKREELKKSLYKVREELNSKSEE
jgi:uncharacterized protein YlxW (UPF0749 family)